MIDFSMRVMTPSGEKPLIDIRVGDILLSVSGTRYIKNKVTKRIESSAGSLMKLSCNGSTLMCAPTQTLATKAQTTIYKKAGTVCPGYMILRMKDGIAGLEEVTSMESRLGIPIPVIGFQLEKYPFNFVINGFICGADS